MFDDNWDRMESMLRRAKISLSEAYVGGEYADCIHYLNWDAEKERKYGVALIEEIEQFFAEIKR